MANEFVRHYYENRYVYITSDEFSNGIAAVKKGGKWGYIDETGREVVPCVYDMAGDFREGLALANKDGKSYLLKVV